MPTIGRSSESSDHCLDGRLDTEFRSLWQRHEVLQLTARRTAIEADIAEMKVAEAVLAKKGARIKPTTCGKRLCVAVSTDQGQVSVDFTSAWHAPDGTPLLIPKGY